MQLIGVDTVFSLADYSYYSLVPRTTMNTQNTDINTGIVAGFEARAKLRRSRWQEHVFHRSTGEDEDVFDRAFWAQAGAEARFSAAWKMVREVELFRGKRNVSQSRLQRSVQRVQRRKR